MVIETDNEVMEIPKFYGPFRAQKRPYIVDVWEITHDSKIPNWAVDNVSWYAGDERFLMIRTLEGTAQAKLGDFVIKGIVGEIYPCRRDIFLETYEVVLDE